MENQFEQFEDKRNKNGDAVAVMPQWLLAILITLPE